MYSSKEKKCAILLLEDGRMFNGFSIGSQSIALGELCFSTSMIGYQHTITDPSFAGQIISFTFPHIGIVGVNEIDYERDKIYAEGIVFREVSEEYHYLSSMSLGSWLSSLGVSGIYGVDTRSITSHIRDYGHKYAYIVTIDDFAKFNPNDYKFDRKCNNELFIDKFNDNSCFGHDSLNGHKIVVVDFGLKSGIVKSLRNLGCSVKVVHGSSGFSKVVKNLNPDGVVLSNGPGDPSVISGYASNEILEIIDSSIDVFGICLGHQLLAISLSSKTVKMRNGHRGANHPVIDLSSGRVEITSQNHGYMVDKDSLQKNLEITHLSLFDESIEGLRIKGSNVFSVQYHPEGSPGTHDSQYLFKKFIDNIK